VEVLAAPRLLTGDGGAAPRISRSKSSSSQETQPTSNTSAAFAEAQDRSRCSGTNRQRLSTASEEEDSCSEAADEVDGYSASSESSPLPPPIVQTIDGDERHKSQSTMKPTRNHLNIPPEASLGPGKKYRSPSHILCCSSKRQIFVAASLAALLLLLLAAAVIPPALRTNKNRDSTAAGQENGGTPSPTPFRGAVAPGTNIPNDSCERAVGPLTIQGASLLSSLDNDEDLLNAPAGLQPSSTCLVDDTPAGGRWYIVMGGDEVLRASTCEYASHTNTTTADLDTTVAVFQGPCGANGDHSGLECVAANDQFCGNQSSVSWYARKGIMYFIYVRGTSRIKGAVFRLRITYEENGLCSAAIGPVANDGTVVAGSMRGASSDLSTTCSLYPAKFDQVWYKVGQRTKQQFEWTSSFRTFSSDTLACFYTYQVTGTGGWMSASTCDEITSFEAHIDVIGNACYSGICSGVRESVCGNGYRSVWKSVMNAEYFLLIYKSTNLPGTLFGLTVDTFNPVANDLCTNAISVQIGGAITNGATWTATHDQIKLELNESERLFCGLPLNSQPGVWYRIQGTANTLLASTCNNATDFATKISIFRGGCDALECVSTVGQFCGEKASVYWDSVLGEEYLVFVHGADYGISANIGSFGLEVSEFVPEVNDLCANAIAIDAIGSTILGSTFAATHDNVTQCSGFESETPGVWYKVAFDTDVSLRASTCNHATNFDTIISIYQGSCGNLSCVIADDNSCGIQSSVKWTAAAGMTYHIHVNGPQISSIGDFALLVEIFIPTAANDFCVGAFELSTGDDSLTVGSTENATFDNAGSCSVSNSAPGIWYKIIGKGTIVNASLCHPETDYDTALSVYTGECHGLECRAGNADGARASCGRHSELSWVAKPGTLYYLLVHGYDLHTGSFGLTVSEPASVVVNDYCVNATPLFLGKDAMNGRTVDATNDEAPICTDVLQDGAGIWYTVPGDGQHIVASTCSEVSDFDTKISVYEGTCGSLSCVRADDNSCGLQSRVEWQSVLGVTYYILVHGNVEGSFALVVDRFVPQQPNNECHSAIGPVFADDQVVLGSTVGASFDDVGVCSVSNTGPGVWYFVFGTGERLKADTCNATTNFDTKLSVFTGLECGALECVGGNDDGCGLQSSFTWDTEFGELYWVLVHGFDTNREGTFGLTVSGSEIFRL
jgi:hypothetical protein